MSKSLPRNAVFGFLSWALPLCLTFVATPLVVRGLGAEEYGLYALIMGFVAYSFTFGIGRAVTKYVSEYLALNQPERISDVLSATLWLNVLVAVGGALIITASANFLVVSIFQIQPEMQVKAIKALYLAAATIFFLMQAQVFSAVVQAVHRFDIFSLITTVTATLSVIGNIILVLLGGDSLELLVWNFAANLFSCLVFFFAARRILPEIHFFLIPSRKMLRLVAIYSGGVVGYQISGNLLLLFERGWITRKLGTESLTFYAVPMLLAFFIHSFVASFSLVLLPLTSETAAVENHDKLLSIYTRATKYILSLVVFLGVSLSITSREFLGLWLGAEFAQRSTKIFVLHIATYSLTALLIVTWQLIEGYGLPSYNAFLSLSFLIVSVPLMIALIEPFGGEGVAAARLLGVLPIPVFIYTVERRIFKKFLWRFWTENLMKLLLIGATVAVVEYLAVKNLPHNWFGLIISLITGGAVFLAALLAIGYLNDEERRWWESLMKRAITARV